MRRKNRLGFSILEIMIVVTIIGFLAGLGIPSFMKARAKAQTTRCIDNLRLLNASMDQWAVENYANNGDPCNESDLAPFFKRELPKCPGGGTYPTPWTVGDDPTCTLGDTEGHTL